MYSRIFIRSFFFRSVLDRSLTTKSGQMEAKPISFCSVVRASHLSLRIHEASGDRTAPLGSVKAVEESKALPVPSAFDQTTSCDVRSALRIPVPPLVGGIASIAPRA